MKISLLVGKVIGSVRTFGCEPVHPAWVDERTAPIATSVAFIELQDGTVLKVCPCEVPKEGRYPALGLVLEECTRDSMRAPLLSGSWQDAEPLNAIETVLPLIVASIAESDPLGEGAVSELRFLAGRRELIFRHIMPPMTLGIEVRSK